MKKTIKLIVIGLVFCQAIASFAQQDPNFNMYRFNMNTINPAYAGSTETAEIVFMHKNQWIGLSNAPSTQSLFYSAPKSNNLGIGGSIVHDDIFVLKQTQATLDVSYKLNLSEATDLYFGIKPGLTMKSANLINVGQTDTDALFNRAENATSPIFGFGFYLKNEDFYVTLSTPNVIDNYSFVRTDGKQPLEIESRAHAYLGAGYSVKVNEYLKLTPEFMIRAVSGAPNSYNLAVNSEILNRINAGVNYRIEENVAFYFLFDVNKKVSLGFGYDYTTSDVVSASNNNSSIEFLLKYKFL